VSHSHDETTVAQPEVMTLHWEGPAAYEAAPEHRFPDSEAEERAGLEEDRERELDGFRRSRQGHEIWEQIQSEAKRRGDDQLWRRKLHAYGWVKMTAEGTAGDYARRHRLNHATVRSWIADVSKLAYQVGYRLHEDRLVLVGEAPAELRRLRELVNAGAASPEASQELRRLAPRFRGEDPYFHLNEGHVHRALGRLRDSDETLREGLTVAEASVVRSLLWNARGQTYWECTATSAYPLRDHLVRAEKAFRRAAVLNTTLFFPFVNLAQMAMDEGDEKRCEYWIGELAAARKRMGDEMKDDLARYLDDAEWTRPVESERFWKGGPAKWLREAAKRGALTVLTIAALAGALLSTPATALPLDASAPDTVEHGGRRGGNNSGAGGN
jgi:hypothetical protein